MLPQVLNYLSVSKHRYIRLGGHVWHVGPTSGCFRTNTIHTFPQCGQPVLASLTIFHQVLSIRNINIGGRQQRTNHLKIVFIAPVKLPGTLVVILEVRLVLILNLKRLVLYPVSRNNDEKTEDGSLIQRKLSYYK